MVGREKRAESRKLVGKGTAFHGSKSRIPNRKAPAGRSPRVQRRRPENGMRPCAFFGDTVGNVECVRYYASTDPLHVFKLTG